MSAKNIKPISLIPMPRPLVDLVGFLSKSKQGHTFVLGTIMLLGFGLGIYFCWQQVSAKALASSEYRVDLEDIVVSAPPSWLHCDVRKDVFEDLSVDGPLSIMDPSVTKRVKDIFAMHPWVRRVIRVSKRFPARVEVELEYRLPACLIVTSGHRFPVDAKGYVLRSDDFSKSDLEALPQVVGIDTRPVISEGAYWNDKQVDAAARIGAALRPVWEKMNLENIQLVRHPSSSSRQNETPHFELITKGGTIILWGPSRTFKTSQDQTGSPFSNEAKVARLKHYLDKHGTLDVLGNRVLDLRATPAKMANASY